MIAGINYPLAADHAGKAAESFGVLVHEPHVALRGLFIVGPTARLEYAVVHALNIGRSTDETLRVLAAPLTFTDIERRWSAGESDVRPLLPSSPPSPSTSPL